MKKTLLMTGALLALTAGLAFAGPGGLSLAWLDCDGGGGAHNRTFACNTNTGGGHILVASFVASSHMTAVTGYSAVIDFSATGGPHPAWWDIRVGGCKAASSMNPSTDFTGGPFTCYDYWQGSLGGGAAMDAVGVPNAGKQRIKAQHALPLGDARITAIAEGTEVYCLKLTFNNARTVGLGACAGCLTSVCFSLNSILVTQTPGNPDGNKFLTNPIANTVTWQGGDLLACSGATPAKNATWGQVKSLYR